MQQFFRWLGISYMEKQMTLTMTLLIGLFNNKIRLLTQGYNWSTWMTRGKQKRRYGVWGQGGYLMLAKTNFLSYRSNLNNILNCTIERFVEKHMDWIIYHLTCDVLTHYWYGVQCKAFGFVKNQKHEGIVCSTIICTSAILNTNVPICKNEEKDEFGIEVALFRFNVETSSKQILCSFHSSHIPKLLQNTFHYESIRFLPSECVMNLR